MGKFIWAKEIRDLLQMKDGSKELLIDIYCETLNFLRLIISNVAKSKVSNSGHVLVLTTEEKEQVS